MYHFELYNVLLVIATNTPQRLKTAFVGGPGSHMCICVCQIVRRQIMLTEVQCCQGHGFSVTLGLFYTLTGGGFVHRLG